MGLSLENEGLILVIITWKHIEGMKGYTKRKKFTKFQMEELNRKEQVLLKILSKVFFFFSFGVLRFGKILYYSSTKRVKIQLEHM